MSYLMLWSGGKDSCFALYKALLENYKITQISITTKEQYELSYRHNIDLPLLAKFTLLFPISLEEQTYIITNFFTPKQA